MISPPASAPSPKAGLDPWLVLSRALGLSERGDSNDLLPVLIARALGALGIPELATIWLDSIDRDSEHSRLADGVREALQTLEPARVSPDRLRARVESALADHHALEQQLRAALPEWRSGFVDRRWFRANDGRHVILHREPGRSPPQRLTFPDAGIRTLDRALFENTQEDGVPPAPVILDGLSNAESLADLCRRSPRLQNRAWARIYACENDRLTALDALATEAFKRHLGEERLRFFVGPDAQPRLMTHLGNHNAEWSSLRYVPDDAAKEDADFQSGLVELANLRAREYTQLCSRNNARYASRDPVWWRNRFAGALAGKEPPLRVLVRTTRFSTYIQHASQDIVHAIEAAGHRAKLLIEPDDSSASDGLSIAREVDDFEPDATLLINYTRASFGNSCPGQIPHVCWIQDDLSHLHTQETQNHADSTTLFVGNVFTSMVEDGILPAEQCVALGVPASGLKFNKDPIEQPDQDLFIATNHGQSPEQLRDQLIADCAESGGPDGLVQAIYQSLDGGLPAWRDGHLVTWMKNHLASPLEHYGVDPSGPLGEIVVRDVATPLVNRMLRHRLVRWAAELADEHGLGLRVAGRGWEEHPLVAVYATGEIPHGPALRDEYNNAALCLQTSAASLLHQRVHECLLAGSMPAIMLTPDDMTAIMRPARATTRSIHQPSCSRVADRKLQVFASEDATLSLCLSTAQRVASTTDCNQGRSPETHALRSGMFLWRDGDGSAGNRIPEFVPLRDQARFIDSISHGMFWTKDDLLGLIRQARERPSERLSRIRHAKSLTERSFTYERSVQMILARLASRFAAPA